MSVGRKTWLLALLLLTPAICYADSESGPLPYATESADGRFIFVMFGPGRPPVEIPVVVEERHVVRSIATANYPSSGLYVAGSNTPLWTVDWYAPSVIVPADGIHLIRRGRWARTRADEAYTFYANGKELRSYKISELADTVAGLNRTVSHFEFEESARLDESRHLLIVSTFSKETFVFDYTTGEMISARRPLRAVLLVGAILLVAFVAWRLRRRKAS